MAQFLHGAIMLTFAACGLCFLRFWRRSHDRLFLMFSIAFWILAGNRLVLALLQQRGSFDEHRALVYAVRLAAFTLLLIAIIDKNRAVGRSAGSL